MNLIDLRYMDDLKDLDLDMVDISKPAPEFEPNRQFYFMAKARSWVKKKSEELGRPMTFFTQTFGWGMVFLTGGQSGLSSIGKKSWIFLILSGLATGASWLCYYKALQMGDASKVVPIDKMSVVITLILAFVFLHESVTPKTVLGCVLIGAGTLLMVL